MIKRQRTTVAIEGLDEVPYCRKCCIRWAECKGQQIRSCHLIQTILRIQEERYKLIYTLGGEPVTGKQQ